MKAEKFLRKVCPEKITMYIERRYNCSKKLARAVAYAEIAVCYRDLLSREEENNFKKEKYIIEDIIEGEYEEIK